MKNKVFPYLIIALAASVFYLPILLTPDILLARGNDLEEFFWPLFYYVKSHLLADKVLPLWNNLILSGTPLLPDPQAPLFYPLNIFALVLPLNTFFVFSFMIHTFIGGAGFYLCSKHAFKFTDKTSLVLALLYTASPKLAGYLEAGHVGLINSMAWIPFALLGGLMLRKKPTLKYAVLFGISLALLYYSHLPTFLIISFAFGLLALTRKSILYLLVSVTVVFGLTAVSLLPQLEWQKYSTRYLLLENPDVYPKWNSILEPIKNALVPWLNGSISLRQINTEKWTAMGIIPFVLAFLGFLKLKNKTKIILAGTVLIISLIILNNASPICPILLKQNWYLLLRVSTRFWILIVLIALFLTGLALEKTKSKIVFILATLGIAESVFLSWQYLYKPFSIRELAPKEVYEFLALDHDRFRVLCVNRCLSQKEAAIHNLELVDGYNTLIQKNYNSHALQLTGTYWNYYTLSIPPIGSLTETLHPNINSLGEYNTKYIISPYHINDIDLKYLTKIEDFIIYLNKKYKPRSPAPIIKYLPNIIIIDISNYGQKSIVISEVYSKGWKAYSDKNKELQIQETPNRLRHIDLPEGTKTITLKYDLLSF